MANTQIVSDAAEFLMILSSTDKEIIDWHILSEDLIQVDRKYARVLLGENEMTKVFWAVFTAAHTRLRLYNVLYRLRKNVLYFDPDSVGYVMKVGEDEPPVGDFLGDLTDELHGKHIVEFVSAGPKNYQEMPRDKESTTGPNRNCI